MNQIIGRQEEQRELAEVFKSKKAEEASLIVIQYNNLLVSFQPAGESLFS
jgi:hypothetical protein